VPNLTKQMSSTFTLYRYHLDVFTTVVQVFLDRKQQHKDNLIVTCFRDVPVVQSWDFQNFTKPNAAKRSLMIIIYYT